MHARSVPDTRTRLQKQRGRCWPGFCSFNSLAERTGLSLRNHRGFGESGGEANAGKCGTTRTRVGNWMERFVESGAWRTRSRVLRSEEDVR